MVVSSHIGATGSGRWSIDLVEDGDVGRSSLRVQDVFCSHIWYLSDKYSNAGVQSTITRSRKSSLCISSPFRALGVICAGD